MINDERPPESAKPDSLFLILKIQPCNYLERLRQGFMYMNTLRYFLELEDKEESGRGDRDEGMTHRYDAKKVRLVIGAGEKKRTIDEALVDSVRIHMNDVLDRRVFCLHAIYPEVRKGDPMPTEEALRRQLAIPASCARMGSSILYIGDFRAFMDRVCMAAKKRDLTLRAGLVRYVDLSKYHGAIPQDDVGFIKDHKFKDQREYRVMVWPAPRDVPFELAIRDISDISKMSTIEKFNMDFEVEIH